MRPFCKFIHLWGTNSNKSLKIITFKMKLFNSTVKENLLQATKISWPLRKLLKSTKLHSSYAKGLKFLADLLQKSQSKLYFLLFLNFPHKSHFYQIQINKTKNKAKSINQQQPPFFFYDFSDFSLLFICWSPVLTPIPWLSGRLPFSIFVSIAYATVLKAFYTFW